MTDKALLLITIDPLWNNKPALMKELEGSKLCWHTEHYATGVISQLHDNFQETLDFLDQLAYSGTTITIVDQYSQTCWTNCRRVHRESSRQ